MNKTISLFKKVYIHPLLWVVVAIAIATAHFIELSLLLLIIFIHEMGHAAAASFFSWRIKKISLLPFGGVAEMDEHGNRSLYEEAVVVAAGPLQHLWMFVVAYALYTLGFIPDYWYARFIEFNMMVLLFNLLPVWPLDGGKLLFLLLSFRKAFPHAHQLTIYLSAFSLLLFTIAVLILGPFTLNVFIIVVFLSFSLIYEWRQRRYVFLRFLMERYYGNQGDFRLLMPLNVSADEELSAVLEQFQRGCKHQVIVKNKNGTEAALDENELLHVYFSEKNVQAKMGDLVFPY
ncbi:M50 family metallopeptidase [Bacillus sp. B15-48]|uniref:M50 family metallopeptidase n=1 Tax=Bacillus sp. B15-48 TaxID=1548601 RepID=UPI00193F416D|nr:M50 family metallopeptidase [Bacillus sp. B15-48]MBM4762431.1 stage IV sporulation protein FB [Bacillus sp. B15-48]